MYFYVVTVSNRNKVEMLWADSTPLAALLNEREDTVTGEILADKILSVKFTQKR